MKNRSLFAKSLSAQIFCGLLIAVASLALSSCHSAEYYYYKFPKYTFANRPKPPSKLAQRVMITYTVMGSPTDNSSLGAATIVDAKRDIRSNIQGTVAAFPVNGYSGGYPSMIFNFPEEVHGYVYSPTAGGTLDVIDYSKESSAGPASKGLTFPNASIAIPLTFDHYYAAEESAGRLVVVDNTTGSAYGLNLPGVYKVAVNQGDTVVIAMVRNSNTIYRLVRLNANQFPTATQATQSTGATDCQPFNLPVYCIVPVNTDSAGGTAHSLDRPVGAYFSLDGATADILNCGPECGGTTASVTFLQQSALNVNSIPTRIPDTAAFTADVPVPGGVTVALSDANTLYVAGQQKMPDGLFTGYLSTIDLTSITNPANAITGKYSISDGTHTKLLRADDNTLWIGSQFCATGERQKLNQNYNCLTRFDLGAKTAQVVPNVNPSDPNSSVPYPNTNQNLKYYGDLTGLCWVQQFHKIYTAYGGQVHVFRTTDGSEIDNQFVTVQGTALDVAYIDALTNVDN